MYSRVVLAVLASVAVTACGESSGPEVFSRPAQLFVRSALNDQVIQSGTRSLTSGAFTLAPGVDIDVVVEFVYDDGTLITPLPGEFLEVTVGNETVGTFTQDQPGGFTGTMEGLTNGTTTLVFRYMYGGQGSGARVSFVSATFDFVVG